MSKTHSPYTPEFRRQMIELVHAGRDPTDLAREFEPSRQTISNWVAQADRQEGRREAKPVAAEAVLTAAEREALIRLRREVRQLRLERDILSKAAAPPRSADLGPSGMDDPPPGGSWFARETGTIPSASSASSQSRAGNDELRAGFVPRSAFWPARYRLSRWRPPCMETSREGLVVVSASAPETYTNSDLYAVLPALSLRLGELPNVELVCIQ